MTSTRSLPYPLGFTLSEGNANFAIYSETATSVEVCVFDADGHEARTTLTEKTGHVFHGFVDGVTAGTRYGVRVDGPWDPSSGLRHNPNKVLLDPHALAVEGGYTWDQLVFGHDMNEPDVMDESDSALSTPKGVVVERTFDWGGDAAPSIPLDETIVYEVHVKGFTMKHPQVPEEIRGTYAGLAHPAAIKHLTDLGITSVELLPVHQFVQDSHLLDKGLLNYWGYNSRVLRPSRRLQLCR